MCVLTQLEFLAPTLARVLKATKLSAKLFVDINECEIPDNCVNGNCSNLLPPEFYRCDCDAGFEGSSCTISVETPTCPSISESTPLSSNNVTFPVTEYGVVAVVSCSQLSFGNITRQCLDTGPLI